MRAAMIGAFGALALACLASGCSTNGGSSGPGAPQGAIGSGPAVAAKKPKTAQQEFVGSSFTISTTDTTSTTLHSFQAKGQSGVASVQSLLVAKNVDPANPVKDPARCPANCGSPDFPCHFIVDVVSMTWVQTYNDMSAFVGAIPNDPTDVAKYNQFLKKSFVCTDGANFQITAKGQIITGTGRYDGLKENGAGTWSVEATTKMSYLTEGNFSASFEYDE